MEWREKAADKKKKKAVRINSENSVKKGEKWGKGLNLSKVSQAEG